MRLLLGLILVLHWTAVVQSVDILGALFGGGKKKESGGTTTPPSSDGSDGVTDDKANNYLQQYGYIAPSALSTGGLAADFDIKNVFKSAVRKFQEFAGITPTGVLDVKTKKKMAEPRCGVYDVQAITSGRDAAFKWNKNTITYSILSYSTDLPHSDITKAIRRAFGLWAEVTPLEFVEVSSSDSSADIKVKFAPGSHGDPWPFDGRGGVLAHATMPTSGMLHFDEDENWVFMDAAKIATLRYTDLLPVAIHEIGHTLGLSHARTEDSIMAPFYQETVDSNGNYVTPHLHAIDIRSIQEIYGPRRGGSSRTSIDDNGNRHNGNRFGSGRFGDSGNRFGSGGSRSRDEDDDDWTATTRRPHHHGSGLIGSLWSKWFGGGSSSRNRERDNEFGSTRESRSFGECPSTIDAVARGTGSGTKYFFHGSKVYEFEKGSIVRMDSLRNLFPNGPPNVDAALTNEKSDGILLFHSHSVYAFDLAKDGKGYRLNPDFPKKINNFDVSGAFQWIDANQIIVEENGKAASYDEYWNQARSIGSVADRFPGFPKALKGGFVLGSTNSLTLFTSTHVYQYDATRKLAIGEPQSIRAYLGCETDV